jgi:hypothetical protein
MALTTARSITTERFSDVLIYLNLINQLELPPGQQVAPDIKMMRGLFFVLLYGALEKSITETVVSLLTKIKSLKPRNDQVVMSFNVVSMQRKWKSIKDTGHKDSFVQMKEFFTDLGAAQFHDFDETMFSSLLQNVWAKTIKEVIDALGVSGFSLTTNQKAYIDELVEKRNAIAHGRESALTVGENYRCDELRKRLSETQILMFALIDRLEKYFDAHEFLQNSQ